MNGEVSWLLEVAVKPGRLDELRTVMDELVESTRAEPGALTYTWSVSDDGTMAHVIERYTDSAAALAHLDTFGSRFAERFLATADPTRFIVYGDPGDEVRAALEASRPTYMTPPAGIER